MDASEDELEESEELLDESDDELEESEEELDESDDELEESDDELEESEEELEEDELLDDVEELEELTELELLDEELEPVFTTCVRITELLESVLPFDVTKLAVMECDPTANPLVTNVTCFD